MSSILEFLGLAAAVAGATIIGYLIGGVLLGIAIGLLVLCPILVLLGLALDAPKSKN